MSQSIFDAFPIVAQAIGESRGVRVRFKDVDAYTNGEMINIPPFDPEKAAPEVLRKAWGYLDHAAFHVLLTDFSVYGQAVGTLRMKSPLGPTLLNILEDVRIEAEGRRRYPGARRNLDQVVQQGVTEGFLAWPEGDWKSPDLVQAYLLYSLRHQVLGQEVLADRAQQAATLLADRHGRALVQRIDAAVAPIRQAASTADVVAVVEQLLEMLSQEAQPRGASGSDDQGTPEASSASDSDAQGDEGTPSAASDGDTEAAEPGEGGRPASSSEAGDSAEASAEEPSSAGAAQAESQPSTPDAETAAGGGDGPSAPADEDAGAATEEPERSLDLYRQAAQQMRQAWHASGEGVTPINTSGGVRQIDTPDPKVDQQAPRMTARLRGWLAGMLEAQARERRRLQAQGRRVKASRLHRLRLGDPQIFEHRHRGRGRDTAVVVLNDVSGSMRGVHGRLSRIQSAQIASASVSEALDGQRGIRSAMLSFSTAGIVHRRLGERHWRVPPSAVRPDKSTRTDEAVAWAIKELRPVREDRKIVVLVTDGEPDDPAMTHWVVRQARQAGIEVLGVGIFLPAIEDLGCTRYRVVEDIEQLPRELFGMLQEALAPAA